jgi:hypothetical protein
MNPRIPKWTPILDIWNTSYGQKKGEESNWQFDSRSLEARNRLDFLVCRWCATYHWKALDKGYNFSLNLIAIRGLHTKLWGPKVARVSTLGMLKLPFGSPRTKCHLDVGLMERHRVYYKGENGGFPQVRVMVNLVSPRLPVVCCSTKSVATLLWPSVGVKPNTWKKRGFGVLRDSWMFRARQQGAKHLALGCSWCRWKGLKT